MRKPGNSCIDGFWGGNDDADESEGCDDDSWTRQSICARLTAKGDKCENASDTARRRQLVKVESRWLCVHSRFNVGFIFEVVDIVEPLLELLCFSAASGISIRM